MNIAVLPWAEDVYENKMFTNVRGGADVYTRVCRETKAYFESRGHRFETLDQYDNWDEVDWIILHTGAPLGKNMPELLKKGQENKLIYRAYEPEVVMPRHSRKKIKKLLNYYKYIITWNKDLVDDKRIFWNNISYIMKPEFGQIPFKERKLLVAIYSNKSSNIKLELYSLRRELFRYFEDYANQFDLYGYGWSAEEFKNYRGIVDDKAGIYHTYRFAVAFENEKDVAGYVTEKIFDCINAGVVPIYYGASDICEYVPEDVFIDYRKFGDIGKLHRFLEQMDEDTWGNYIKAGRKYLALGQTDMVGVETYCRCLEKLMTKNPANDIHCSTWHRMLFRVIGYWDIMTAMGYRKFLQKVWQKINPWRKGKNHRG